MCGIVAYIGKNKAKDILIDGLKKLEYRGYDSSGLALMKSQTSNNKSQKNENIIICVKEVGKVKKLEQKISKNKFDGNVGIAHTRWATHGKPSLENAHPHTDCAKKFYIVHNGIIENYKELRDWLIKKKHKFISDTDSEVIAHLLEEFYNGNLEDTITLALGKIKGAYGLAIIFADEPNKLIIARNGSPILFGVGKDEFIVASDAAAIVDRTKKVIYLDDGEFAILDNKKYKIFNLKKEIIKKKAKVLELDQEQITKSGYRHFMAKEIHEAPEVIFNSSRGRTIENKGEVKLGGLEPVLAKLKNIDRLIIVGCGTARYAGLVGEYMIEEFAKVPVEVEYASEFRYRKPIINKNTAVVAISQSGETADTLAAIKEAKKQGALTLGIVNVVGSTIARETNAGVYNHIGPEIAVASTKAFISQLIILALLTIFLGRSRNMNTKTAKEIIKGIKKLPDQIQEIFDQEDKIKRIAQKYKCANNFLYLGRKYNYPIAMEGALKLKEISYLHAEGYPTGEMKHGPIAMINKKMPTVLICPQDSVYEKNLSGAHEIKARDGSIIAIATKKDKKIAQLTDDVIYIPKNIEMLNPILTAIPLQLLAYYISIGLGYDIDKPRNLAKSVTVE